MDKPRILCCIPSYKGPEPHPFFSFLLLATEVGRAESEGKYKVRWNVGGPKVRVPVVRNQACAFALNGDATHLLFIDDDMLVPPGAIEHLLALDLPIVSPIFYRGGKSHDPLVFDWGEDGKPHPMKEYPVDTLFLAPAGVGTGVMMIKTEVLKAMDPPYFYYPQDPTMGMDLEFCRRAAEIGFASYCDSRILVRQMGLNEPVGEAEWLERKEYYYAEKDNPGIHQFNSNIAEGTFGR
jgi:hypothetical protein